MRDHRAGELVEGRQRAHRGVERLLGQLGTGEGTGRDHFDAEVRAVSRGDSRVVDLRGAFVVPLFHDVTPVGMTITKDGSKILITLGRANHLARKPTSSRPTTASER